ncbi:hypothetical protein DFJ73DRAFT_958943 [Zopfochytrium polystomum]|nr:hypothetical protein DFJ73DRAFT_958943 [Zopfochytrium polystomum]
MASSASDDSTSTARLSDLEELAVLVRRLAPARTPRQRADAANAILRRLEQEDSSIGPFDVIVADAVPALLHAAQTPKRSTENLQPDPSTPVDVVTMSDSSLLVLSHLCSAGVQILADAGWQIDDDGTGRGRPVYIHPGSGQSRDTPPDDLSLSLPPSISSAVASNPDAQWALDLLFELSTLTTPYASPLDGRLIWPARVRHHEPANPASGPGSVEGLPARTQALTVVDVVQDDDEENAEGEDGTTVPMLASTRHLVLGPWHGVTGFRETEVDLDAPPGTHLESWYTCALAATALLAIPAARAGRGRVLMLGLGGGAVPAFINRHWPGVAVEAVESERSVVKVAERWFGLSCEPSVIGPVDGVFPDSEGRGDPDEIKETPNFVRDVVARTTRLRITAAETFAVAAASDPECRYDAVLVDVYTRGSFPVPLLNQAFFDSLVKLLKPSGWLCVNAGVGGDRAAVEGFVRKCVPSTVVLMDGTKGSLEGDYENAVVVGLPAGAGVDSVSPSAWKERTAEVRESWPDAPVPPFTLSRVVTSEDDELKIFWDGASPADPEKPAPAPELLDKSDPAFELFD